MADKAAELQAKLEELRQTYISQLGERFDNLDAANQAITASSDFASAKEALEQLAFHAHKLAGTAGTFGFTELGEKGSEIEQRCEEHTAAEKDLTAEDKQHLTDLVATCHELADI